MFLYFSNEIVGCFKKSQSYNGITFILPRIFIFIILIIIVYKTYYVKSYNNIPNACIFCEKNGRAITDFQEIYLDFQ